jgi:hypothetical protein
MLSDIEVLSLTFFIDVGDFWSLIGEVVSIFLQMHPVEVLGSIFQRFELLKVVSTNSDICLPGSEYREYC